MKSFEEFLVSVKTQVDGIADDSRNVKKGYAFVAIKGLTSDGHKFIHQAKKNGAKIVIGENRDVDIKVSDSRKALSLLASSFYDNPSNKLKVIGVTGTKGKTTTCHLIHHILVNNSKKAGLISTITTDGLHTTTPDILTLNKNLAKMVKDGLEYAVLEVSSHGIDQGRIAGINFDISVLTNIHPEHLDYHKTFKEYKRVKMMFINSAQFRVFSPKETRLRILEGNFNNLNAETAIEVTKELGISEKDAFKALKTFKLPEGRLEKINNNKGIKIFVDFAHTPDSLEAVLKYLRTITKNKLIAVFGCAGDRDKNKRPKMGKIASELADVAVFTAEDPRNEDVNEIIKQILKGVSKNKENIYTIPDRLEAITHAISIAKKGDTVVICGKGHEKSMNFNGIEYPWQDKKAVESILEKSKKVSAIILAAGKGFRMGGKIPKVLLSINGESILSKGLKKIKQIVIDDIVVVTGFESAQVVDAIKETGYNIKIVKQGRKTGTGGATISGLKKISKISDTVLVVYGDDSALYRKKTLQRFIRHYYSQSRPLTVAVIKMKGVSSLGGLEINRNGDVAGVLGPDELTSSGDKETVVLCGLLCFNKYWLSEKIRLIPKNPKNGEYSLPYLLKIAHSEGVAAKPFFIKDSSEWNSVNTPLDLKVARMKGRKKWKE